MIALAFAVIAYCRAFLIGRHRLAMEVAALRHQLVVFKRKQPRPRLCICDRAFWVVLRRLRPGWVNALIIVKPDTVVSWHRAGFRLFWRVRSRPRRLGRPTVSPEVRQLIRRMKSDNPSWGAPRIHGELPQLGFDVSEPTVSRYLQRLQRQPDQAKVQRWLAFLQNHREVMAAFDLFTVPTLSFRVLYCFFVTSTIGAAFSTSKRPRTRQASGLCSSSARRCRSHASTATSSLIVTGNSAPRCARF
jgi:hypothetical protein